MRTFHRLVANTLLAGMTNNLIWFALTFWAYLETKSVIATSVVGGGYMLMLAASGMYFGTFVDRHRRKTSMLVSSVASLTAYALAGALYLVTPAENLRDLGRPEFWALVLLVLAGAIAGNLRTIALSTSVTLLVPPEQHARANGLVGTVNGVSFALTSVFSGLAVGLLGMGWSLLITLVLTGLALAHLSTIGIPEPAPAAPRPGTSSAFDLRGALTAVRAVPGLLTILYFSTFNNLLGGVFMALMDPYGLTLMSVEAWGTVLAVTSAGFIIGGLIVARRGLGARPVRVLLANMAMWTVCILFPTRSSIIMLTVGFLIYLILIPVAESAEQTVIQRVVPLATQGRVFGFAQSLETAASPVTSFLIGPIAQVWVIPFMTTGAGAATIGGWFGTGPDRAMALLFIGAGLIGLVITVAAMRSRAFTALSARYADAAPTASDAASTAPDATSAATDAEVPTRKRELEPAVVA